MENPNEFQKLLRSIMNLEPNPMLSKEDIEQSTQEMGVMELLGNRYVIWLNFS